MSSPKCFQAIYKHVDEQQIDVNVYLPSSQNAKSPVLINIHGGAFMLGSSKMVNKDQVQDCLSRGWIVLAPNHRLCPQVDLLNGPIQDCRDLLAWVYNGGLERSINETGQSTVIPDTDHVFAFGTSSGGTLALCLGFGVPRPVAGIYDMYGPCNFSDGFWTTKLPHLKVPSGLTESFMNKVFEEYPVPITGGVSLEGQSTGPPDFNDPRQAYALTRLGNGTILDAIFPSKDWDMVDPVRNIGCCFPPTFIAHGKEDSKVPIGLSRELSRRLKDHGVHCDMREIPGEDHTFAAKMQVGSQTWELQRLGFDFLESLI
ncbi:unnamed protein product [Penicillium nalgiovense]|uniref:Alpha/beta hydrolase fold-3 domain-containing protein n=1 Tax=Penicillium nalgiovense TaxID=60175 RepID=A0A9W4IHN8_PENNA|nr:unnamed protein product [Penicillium nalgiovense]CAG7965396.1 unnamed protein product [Penicillium nalgiovense]CAG7967918.1 unnamed protein product [Penicillium nalgiovense]CAG7971832.1 unnamed protein product [Penicillium nalgiovense]CAG7973207.1 unnamed protein product [Penicillium nalgiovense]